jgi:hypothetical protein
MTRFPRVLALALTSWAACIIPVGADDRPGATPRKAIGPPEAAEVRFADGSAVRMLLTQPAVDVTTRYGKLSVPVADLRRIEFATRYPDGVPAKIEAAIARLTDPDRKARQAAEAELRTFRELAYPALKRAAASADLDRALQASLLVKWLEEKVGPEKLRVRDQDTIHAAEFTVAGKIEASTLKGRTTYFGEVTVQVSELRSIRFLGGTGEEKELAVEAARFAALSQDVWLDTEVDVTDGAALEIQASGIVDLWPQGGNYKVGPDAMPRMGNSPDGNPAGMLLGRIGERGKVFQVGAKFSGPVADGGRLYLRIACSPWNNPSAGSYAVKINPNADRASGPVAPAPAPPRPAGKEIPRQK